MQESEVNDAIRAKLAEYLLGELLLDSDFMESLNEHLVANKTESFEDLYTIVREFLHGSLPVEIKRKMEERIAEARLRATLSG